MKSVLFLLFCITIVFADDSRLYNHGACFVEFQENDSTRYYITWSSAFDDGWEHDIYHSIVHFNQEGEIVFDKLTSLYIGSGNDEAQEPVHTTISSTENIMLTVWEDGFGPNAPNVRGQLHTPNGTVLRDNWIIAGGEGSQHSANTAHLESSFIVVYADEAAPATVGAVVKAKIIDEKSGEERQTLTFSPYNEDHWWPVSVSNNSNSKTFVVWGNDGYAIMGTVLRDSSGTIVNVNSPVNYLANTQQYYYQVEWLEEISRFLIVARYGAYENISDSSKICLVDTLGKRSDYFIVDGGIERESKMALRWNSSSASYSVLFPTDSSDLIDLRIKAAGEQFEWSSRKVPVALNTHWSTTGIWGEFVKDVNGNLLFGDSVLTLFIQNDSASNDIILNRLMFSSTVFESELSLSEKSLFKNPINVVTSIGGVLHLSSGFDECVSVCECEYELFSINGKILQSGRVRGDIIPLRALAPQILLLKLKRDGVQGRKYILWKTKV